MFVLCVDRNEENFTREISKKGAAICAGVSASVYIHVFAKMNVHNHRLYVHVCMDEHLVRQLIYTLHAKKVWDCCMRALSCVQIYSDARCVYSSAPDVCIRLRLRICVASYASSCMSLRIKEYACRHPGTSTSTCIRTSFKMIVFVTSKSFLFHSYCVKHQNNIWKHK